MTSSLPPREPTDWDALYPLLQNAARQIAAGLGLKPEDAEDIAQDAAAHLHARLPLKAPNPLHAPGAAAWRNRFLQHKALQLRDRKLNAESALRKAAEELTERRARNSPVPEDESPRAAFARLHEAHAERLPDELRCVVVAFVGLRDRRAVAESLGLAVDLVRARLIRAYFALQHLDDPQPVTALALASAAWLKGLTDDRARANLERLVEAGWRVPEFAHVLEWEASTIRRYLQRRDKLP